MNSSEEKFFALVRFSLLGENLPEDFSCGKEELEAIYKLASKHDIVSIIAYALDKNGLLTDDEIGGSFKDELMFAAGRVTLQNIFAEEVFEVFRQEKIDFIPLKGAVIRKLYPQDYFRTSTDIDILVRKEDFDRACNALKNGLGLRTVRQTAHDLELVRSELEKVEVHHSLVEDYRANGVNREFANVWESAKASGDGSYFLSKEIFLLYHIAHMLKHFETGGIGVRFFIDSYYLRKIDVDKREFYLLLKKYGLKKFYEVGESLVDHWLEKKPADDITLKMQSFVLGSGVYGSWKNRATINKSKKKGKFRYALSRIFPSYEELCGYYPKLKERKWLTPFYWTGWLFGKIFSVKMRKKIKELKAYDAVNENDEKEINELFNELELKL